MVVLLRPDPTDPAKPVDVPKAEATVRESERLEAEIEIAQLRAIETGKAQLTADQRSKRASVMAGDDPQRVGSSRNRQLAREQRHGFSDALQRRPPDRLTASARRRRPGE